jgi:proline dehydrogenase
MLAVYYSLQFFKKNGRFTALNMPEKISFSNTQNAFEAKSDADLTRAYWLFKLISNNFLVKIGPPITYRALQFGLPIKPLIRATIYKHFVGGETIEKCEETIKSLWKYNVGSILDYSVEGAETEQLFNETKDEIIRTIKRAKGDKSISFCVFKVTGVAKFSLLEKVSAGLHLSITESAEYATAQSRVDEICKTAYDNGVKIFIDAEESWIQNAIDEMAEKMMMLYNKTEAVVFNTIQLYRHDRLAYLKHSFGHAHNYGYYPGYKLVRGAYMEKERKRAEDMHYEDPIQPDKAASDKDYDEALRFCVDNVDRVSICAGTHNESSSLLLATLMQEKGIAHSHPNIWFSQLLGMSDHISYNLAKAGYNVCKYVPYGPVKSVLPYLFRRASENTSISGQMGRELSLIIQERRRRS